MNLESLQKTLESLSCSVYYSLSLSLSSGSLHHKAEIIFV